MQPGATTYSEEQSRRNYGRIQRLVVAGEPLRSLLLVNPLAEEAGGSHWHGGGKHWSSQNAAEWQTLAEWVRTTTVALDFDFYRNRVEPILLTPRKGNAPLCCLSFAWRRQQFSGAVAAGRDHLQRGAVAS